MSRTWRSRWWWESCQRWIVLRGGRKPDLLGSHRLWRNPATARPILNAPPASQGLRWCRTCTNWKWMDETINLNCLPVKDCLELEEYRNEKLFTLWARTVQQIRGSLRREQLHAFCERTDRSKRRWLQRLETRQRRCLQCSTEVWPWWR